MGKRYESRLRRPTSKLRTNASSEPLPAKRRRRRGVGAVHPNSAAARVWGVSKWTYVGERTEVPRFFRFSAELRRLDDPPPST